MLTKSRILQSTEDPIRSM